MWRGQLSRTGVVGAAFAVFVVCCVLPIGYLLATTLGSASGAYAAVVLDSRQQGLLYNTALLGIGTAPLSTTIGVPLGVALARVPLRRKAVIRLLAHHLLCSRHMSSRLRGFISGAVAGLLAALAGGDLVSEWTYSLPAAILVLSLVLYPLSMLATEAAMRRIDGRLEEAGLIVAPPPRVLLRITLPLVAPSTFAAALIIFVLAVSEFGVPGSLRVRVYTTEVFTAFAALYDFGRAVVLAVPLLVVCVTVAVVAAVSLGDRLVVTRRSLGVSPMVFDRLAPAGSSRRLRCRCDRSGPARADVDCRDLRDAFARNGCRRVASTHREQPGVRKCRCHSCCRRRDLVRLRPGSRKSRVAAWYAGSARCSIRCSKHDRRCWPDRTLEQTGSTWCPLWHRRHVPAGLHGAVRPVAVLVLAATAQAISVSQEEAAAVSGAGWFRTMRRIVLPQMRLGITAAWVIAFVLAFGELGVSILVAPPGEATLPIRVYTIIANTPASNVAALALLQSLVVFVPVAALGAYASLREAR